MIGQEEWFLDKYPCQGH